MPPDAAPVAAAPGAAPPPPPAHPAEPAPASAASDAVPDPARKPADPQAEPTARRDAAIAKMTGKPAAEAAAPAADARDAPAANPADKPAEEKPEDDAAKAKDDAEEDKPKPGEKLGKSWAEVKKRAREQAQAERALKRQAAEFEQRAANIAKAETAMAELQRMYREDPLGLLEHIGITAADIAKRVVDKDAADPRDQELAELRAKLARLEESDAERAKREKAEAEAAEQRAKEQASAENVAIVRSYVRDLKAELPYLSVYDEDLGKDEAELAVAQAAYALMKEHFERTGGGLLAVPDALVTINRNLEADAARLARVNRSASAAPPGAAPTRANGAAAAPAKPEAERHTAPEARTLSNLDAAQRAAPGRELSERERRRNAHALLKSR